MGSLSGVFSWTCGVPAEVWDEAELNCQGIPEGGKPVDMDRIGGLLRGLRSMQEKVLRLYFGLGCKRPHSAQEMAEEFGVSGQAIAGTIGGAQRRLAQEGLTANDLREAARRTGEASASGSPVEPNRRPSASAHRHHRSRVR
jgi:hypothetical protein